MVGHCLQQNFAEAIDENDKLMAAYHLLFAENNPAGAKAFLSEMKIIENVTRLPVVPLSKPLHACVKEFLASR